MSLEELEIPDGMESAEQAIEVFRAWVADGNLHVIFHPGTFENLADWGRLLADCARHIATASALDGKVPAEVAMAQIQVGFAGALGAGPASGGESESGTRKSTGRIKRTRHH